MILPNQEWRFIIEVVLALLAIVIPIVVNRWQKGYKALSYAMTSFPPSFWLLWILRQTSEGKLCELPFDSQEQDVHLVMVEIINSGNTPIRPADYENPVDLRFSESAQLLKAKVFETNPNNLQVTVYKEGNKVQLAPVLLNQGDSITLEMLVSQFDRQIGVYGRVVGVKAISKSARGRLCFWVLTMGGASLLVYGAINLTGMLFFRQPFPERFYFPHIVIYLVLTVLGCRLALVGIVRYSQHWKIIRRYFDETSIPA